MPSRGIFAAIAAAILLSSAPADATPIALDGSWTVMVDDMSAGGFFTGTGTGSTTFAGATSFDWVSAQPVLFRITDLFVVSDTFRVYDNGVALFDVVNGSDWHLIPGCSDDHAPSCHWTDVPGDAWLDPLFSKASHLFAAGSHSIVIQSLTIPLHFTGVTHRDATVAISASEVPEPASMLLLATGLAGVAYRARKRRRTTSG